MGLSIGNDMVTWIQHCFLIFSKTCHRLSIGHVLGPCLHHDEPPGVSLCIFPRKAFDGDRLRPCC